MRSIKVIFFSHQETRVALLNPCLGKGQLLASYRKCARALISRISGIGQRLMHRSGSQFVQQDLDSHGLIVTVPTCAQHAGCVLTLRCTLVRVGQLGALAFLFFRLADAPEAHGMGVYTTKYTN